MKKLLRLLILFGLIAAPALLASRPALAQQAHESVHVTNANAQQTTSGQFLVLSWDTEEWDTNGMHDGTNPTRLTAQTAGYYIVTGQAEFAYNGTARRALVVNISTGAAPATSKVPPITDAGATTILQVVTTVYLGVGDYVTLSAFQASGSNINISGGPQTWFSISLVKDASNPTPTNTPNVVGTVISALTATAAIWTPTDTPTTVPGGGATEPVGIGTPYFRGSVTYGDLGRINALACLISVAGLGLVAWIVVQFMERRRRS